MNSKNRDASKLLLSQEIKGIEELIKMDKNKLLKSQVVAGVRDVKLQLEKCKVLYIANLGIAEGRRESEWIENIYSLYENLNYKIYQYIESVTENELKQKRNIDMKMERLKMPAFSGNIRNYAKFKADFKAQVEVQVKSDDSLSYILKSCLSGEALSAVEHIDESKGIWERLDKKHGQPSLLIDIIMNEVKEAPLFTNEDFKGFIELVNVIEKGYADLKRLSLEREMSNSITVSVIEGNFLLALDGNGQMK